MGAAPLRAIRRASRGRRQARHLLGQLLVRDAKERPTLSDVLKHPFLGGDSDELLLLQELQDAQRKTAAAAEAAAANVSDVALRLRAVCWWLLGLLADVAYAMLAVAAHRVQLVDPEEPKYTLEWCTKLAQVPAVTLAWHA